MKIMLVCTQGISTRVLAKKIGKKALERKLDWRISSIGTYQIEAKLSQADMVLLAPQNRMVKDKVENMCRMEGITAF